MSSTLKEALAKANVPLTSEEELKEQDRREAKHRSKTVAERPTEEYKLHNVTIEPFERKKYQSDPTDDLIEIPAGLDASELLNLIVGGGKSLYCMVWCKDTCQTWACPTKLCLDQNFIYREDLEFWFFDGPDGKGSGGYDFYASRGGNVSSGWITRKTCYILDSPAEEHYEVYYDPSFPAMKYGKVTPNGMFIHKYKDRFYRDMKIMELDKLYEESSKAAASEMSKREFGANEAIVISDGCFMQNVCASSYYYIDSATLMKFTQGIIPSEPDQAVLISEIAGATAALQMCRTRSKKKITYYYDNTSIINVLRNRKTEYIQEVVEYKNLLKNLDVNGYEVKFIELHPKTGDNREEANKALMFFHNYCDKECQDMARIFSRDYRSIAMNDTSDGKTLKQVQKEFAPKGKPGNGSGQCRVQNNSKNGNNKYGRKF